MFPARIIQNGSVKALYDTGATVSITDTQTAEELQIVTERDYKQPYGVTGQRLETHGVGRLSFRLNNAYYSQEFIVVNIPHRRVILGVDFLDEHNAVIDLKRKTPTLDPSQSRKKEKDTVNIYHEGKLKL